MKMKIAVGVTLFIFFVVIVSLLTANLVINAKNSNQGASSATTSKINSPNVTTGKPMLFSLADVAKHNNANDCWLVILNKVYDVTSFIGQHPGGPETIVPYCGKDATKAFQTKDQPTPRDHSNRAYNMLTSFYVGDLK